MLGHDNWSRHKSEMMWDPELNNGQLKLELPIRQPREASLSLGSLRCRDGCRVEIQIWGSSVYKWHLNA